MAKGATQLRSRPEIKAALDEFLTAADSAFCATTDDVSSAVHGGQGFKMIEGRAWRYSTDLVAKQKSLIAKCLLVLSASITSENDLASAMWDAVATSGPQKTREDTFFDAIEGAIRTDKVFVGPNRLVRLIPPLNVVTVGRVKILPTSALNTKKIEIREGNREGLQFDGTRAFLEFPPFAWEVSLRSSFEYAREEAQWAIYIAISLVRLALFSFGKPTGLFPALGGFESHPIEVRTLHNAGCVLGEKVSSFGSSTLPGWYEVGPGEADHFNSMNLSKIADMVFDPQRDSVAERLYNGLGWMTLARQTKPRAERFIHYFTALEALLTSSDPTAPVTQTIARFLSCILTSKNEDRAALASTIKTLYGKRSSLVHGGKRSDIHMSDVKTIQYFVELAYLEVIKKVSPVTPTKDFLGALDLASYGLEWRGSGGTK